MPKEEFKEIGNKNYILGGDRLIIIYDRKLDVVKAYKGEEQVLAFDLYWFAWYAYHPDTKVLEI